MTEARLALGRWGEEEAAHFLARDGWTIVARNVRTPVGELDIVARRKKLLVFIEVKTRRTLAFGTPQEAVGAHKRRQIVRSAQWYLAEQPALRALQLRFDVIAVLAQNGTAEIEHIPDAFGL